MPRCRPGIRSSRASSARRRRDGGPGRRAVVDSHAHLESCDLPVGEVLAEAREAGVGRVVTIGTGRESSERAIALAEANPEVYAVIGVHPHDADAFGPADEAWIRDLSGHPRVVGIGECGLDHHYDHAARDAQVRAFVAQVGLAREAGLPVVIHTREAADETIEILDAHAAGLTVVLHCFSLPDRVAEVTERGWYASFAGPLTYRTAEDLRRAAAALPEDRVMVETDSPYLAPVPRRGRPNRPANVAHTLAKLAEVRGATVEEMDAITTRNTEAAFHRMRGDA